METDMASKTSASGNRLIANNKKAYFDYFIEEKYEAGMVLHGTEVKSIRAGKCSIKESYIKIENGEVYVLGMNITPYEKGNIFNKDPLRPKKLLLHKNQINKLTGELTIKGYTLVPLQVFTWIGNMFSCVPFGIKGWIAVILLAVTMIPVDLIRKCFVGISLIFSSSTVIEP